MRDCSQDPFQGSKGPITLFVLFKKGRILIFQIIVRMNLSLVRAAIHKREAEKLKLVTVKRHNMNNYK